MSPDEDLQGHPDAMRWIEETKAAVAAYEQGRRRRERIRTAIALALMVLLIGIVTTSILNLP